jgi:hypothetical protein
MATTNPVNRFATSEPIANYLADRCGSARPLRFVLPSAKGLAMTTARSAHRAYQRMLDGEARFRMVIDIANSQSIR